jgi:Leucine-rich repeat (LRR) protein
VFFRPLWSLILLLAGLNLSTGQLDGRVFEFFHCMSMPDNCTALLIDNYYKYYFRGLYNDPEMLLNNFENLFSVNAKVRLNKIRGLEIHNTMEEVKPFVFSSLKTLQHLNLANNLIKNVDKDAFVGLGNLLQLILSENLIESLPPKVFNNLIRLQNVSLANNKMMVLNFDNFLFNQKLMLLDVSSNQLTTLLALSNNLALKTLMLAHNNLTDISVLQQLPWLTSLDVSANQLTDLKSVNFKALREIDISQNSWDCKYLSEFLEYLSKRKIATPKGDVINSSNVKEIVCFDTPPPPVR